MADDSGGEAGDSVMTRVYVTTMVSAVLFCAAMLFILL